MRAALIGLLLGGCLLGAGCGRSSSNSSSPPTQYVNPPKPKTRIYTVPSSAMEPTLHCARGPSEPGCLGSSDDRVLVQPGKRVKRGDIVVFQTPKEAALKCGEGGTFIKRVIGLPGETVREDDGGVLEINGKRLSEPYVSADRRLADSAHFNQSWHVPNGDYFMVGDNRSQSCDSRTWGSVPARNVIGPVVKIIRAR